MAYSIQEIAVALGAEALGDTELLISALAEPVDAGRHDLALATNPKYAETLAQGHAQAALLWPGADWQALGLRAAIIAPRPRYAMAGLTRMMDAGQGFGTGIHPTAVIDPTAEIADGVSIGPLTVIGARARIGAGTIIGPQCHIGMDATLGEGVFLREQVSIGARATLGARVIAQPGVRIGGDGFSFVTPEKSTAEQARETLGDTGEAAAQPWARIHSLGAVTIGDDVEVGANSSVDNGTVRDTVVGSGTKIDSLVQVGHNVVIGRDCLLCAQSGVAGSTTLGNNVVLAGQSGVADNLVIGDNVVVAASSAVLSNVPAGRAVMGYPAVKMDNNVEIYKATRRLPRLLSDVAALKKAVLKAGGSS
ncbi:UDP-3-O-[3-hydroxymyristoyl] glucosamine N-acyltransferase [Salinihabitans flavidus]|uniref:UDP-3-O-acylglucosamine N-acyltransferase n=1 Tax=Salinihabitans flavidus TaxID=569882 RepID=A0A1H8V8Z8_9RHOB|nr:UDP-3-O-(3-hydroxymyristoyl)glucosamine N-acyltransferase [Salinihabitans flavidus]SEP11743.1 UDP-3-O-[3-hydroxymyristoyl] glucosamine N-acyltransferase [Salinihabitans flavidus]